MKTRFIPLLAGMLLFPALTFAQPTAHYVPGTEGIKGATLPPPGVYVRDYNLWYTSDRANDNHGNNVSPPGLDVFTYANAPRLIWISDTAFLGGNVGVDALVPLVYKSLQFAGFSSTCFGIGDVFAEGTLSWHTDSFDFSAGAGVWAPTGNSGSHPATDTRAGQGYWTPMLTAGAVWYVDKAKTWAVSSLNRYEFNTEQRDTHITPGQAYTMEWAISKTIKVVDIGVVGYYQTQVTKDEGTGASDNKDRVAGIGPEVSVAIPKATTFVSLRYVNEFMAEDRAQGQTFTFTVTKRF